MQLRKEIFLNGQQIKSVDEYIQKAGLYRMKKGEHLLVVDPDGKRHHWRAPADGIYGIGKPEVVDGFNALIVSRYRFGAEFGERGGPPFRETYEDVFWGIRISEITHVKDGS